MSKTEFNPQEIIEVFETDSFERANRNIAVGWVMLGVYSNQYSENGYCPKYSLGWLKQNGEVTHPELTDFEKAKLERSKRRNAGEGIFDF